MQGTPTALRDPSVRDARLAITELDVLLQVPLSPMQLRAGDVGSRRRKVQAACPPPGLLRALAVVPSSKRERDPCTLLSRNRRGERGHAILPEHSEFLRTQSAARTPPTDGCEGLNEVHQVSSTEPKL